MERMNHYFRIIILPDFCHSRGGRAF